MKRFRTAHETDRPAGGELPAALYVNYFEMGHNPFEFLLDFGQFRPATGLAEAEGEGGTTVIHSRLAMAPPYAKMLCEMLVRSLRDHEAEHGEIVLPRSPDPLPPAVSEDLLAPLGDFEARARALRAAAHSLRPSSNKG
ncbi:DUF3467 domain-containing protein [Erythrobacter sp. NE805]|uniref:DUF3467 domain-containing protein n=1 Tax=Erythrobacter sp. NE805 TaxID=3389875 RepID=UPI00396B042A